MKMIYVLAAVVLLSGCSAFRYPGSKSATAAVIKESFRTIGTPGSQDHRSTSLLSVDGKEAPGLPTTFYLRPGKHKLKVSCSEQGPRASLYATYTLHTDLKPRHTYVLSFELQSLGDELRTCGVDLLDTTN